MKKLIRGITFSYNRNIGWQDRLVRAVIGVGAAAGAVYLCRSNSTYSIVLGILAVSLFATVLSARCIVCYFTGQCTIGKNEKQKLGIKEAA